MGTIDEAAIGAFKGKIQDRIIKEIGPAAGSHFIDDMTKLAIRAIMRTGLSFGIADEDIPKEARIQINEVLGKLKTPCRTLSNLIRIRSLNLFLEEPLTKQLK